MQHGYQQNCAYVSIERKTPCIFLYLLTNFFTLKSKEK